MAMSLFHSCINRNVGLHTILQNIWINLFFELNCQCLLWNVWISSSPHCIIPTFIINRGLSFIFMKLHDEVDIYKTIIHFWKIYVSCHFILKGWTTCRTCKSFLDICIQDRLRSPHMLYVFLLGKSFIVRLASLESFYKFSCIEKYRDMSSFSTIIHSLDDFQVCLNDPFSSPFY